VIGGDDVQVPGGAREAIASNIITTLEVVLVEYILNYQVLGFIHFFVYYIADSAYQISELVC
jgi:hypothetical protein